MLPDLAVAIESRYMRVRTEVRKAGTWACPPCVDTLVGIWESEPKKFPEVVLEAVGCLF